MKLNDKDLKVETMRASGAGGQHVNTTNLQSMDCVVVLTGTSGLVAGGTAPRAARPSGASKRLDVGRLHAGYGGR